MYGLQKNGKFTKAKKHLADQAKKAMFSLLSTMARLHHPPIPIILQLYESMLKPIMCYGCEIWGFTENTDLEKVELRFLKAILHLPTSAPNMAVRGELGQLPIYMWWKERILKFWTGFAPKSSTTQSSNVSLFRNYSSWRKVLGTECS